MILSLTELKVRILLQLLEFNIENLIDEPDDSPRGEECRACQEMFDDLWNLLRPSDAELEEREKRESEQ